MAGFKDDVPKAVVFPSSPVFCAMGSSIMDIVHLYEQSKRMVFMEPMSERIVIDKQAYNATVAELIDKAKRELASEGLPVEEAKFTLELDMLYGGQVQVKRMSSPLTEIRSDEDALRIYQAFEDEFAAAFSPLVVNKPGGVYLDNFVLRATVPIPKPELPELPLQGEDASAARIGSRMAYWPEVRGHVETPTYSFERLQAGNRVEGPAIVEAELTTVVVPPSMTFLVNEHGLGILESLNTEHKVRRRPETATVLEPI